MDEMTEVAFQIILYAGNGKSSSMEAIQDVKKEYFSAADRLIEEAGEELSKAHHYQSKLLKKEANGEKNFINVMLIHSQDHLMTSMTVRDLAVEIIEIYRIK